MGYVQGETFRDLAHLQEEAIKWCTEVAGERVHGTTRRRPLVVFTEEEKEKLLPLIKERFDTPAWSSPTLHPDHHVRIGYSLYSAPTAYLSKTLDARKDSHLVRLYYKGQLIKTHPVALPGKRSTDFGDYPKEKTAYAMRSCTYHIEKAEEIGNSCKKFMELLLAGDFSWARLRQAQKLLRLPAKYGKERVENACSRALAFDLIDVRRVEGMIVKGLEGTEGQTRGKVIAPARFMRPASYFVKDDEE